MALTFMPYLYTLPLMCFLAQPVIWVSNRYPQRYGNYSHSGILAPLHFIIAITLILIIILVFIPTSGINSSKRINLDRQIIDLTIYPKSFSSPLFIEILVAPNCCVLKFIIRALHKTPIAKAKKSRPIDRDFYITYKLFLVEDIPYTNLSLETRS